MNEAVVLGLLKYFQSFLFGYVVSLAGLHDKVCHITYSDAPVLIIISAALSLYFS